MNGELGRDQRERAYLERLSEVRAAFAARAKAEAGQVTELANALPNPDSRERLRDLAHKTRGTSGTLGFSAIADAAGAVEEAIDSGTPDGDVQPLAATLADRMASAADA